ncbi:putative phenylphosphate carboxylase, alpha subunit [uncultured Desulfobacterium sp.]|uniref:Putative phenylphosphate carboxylase, alpha subunit n=1 Tax=uncultured Desulfobacterium sp. TaxID=201089 RepID=A0A445MSI5_9BACT|nr:putative phenylphosphate carboxylase, alpha subunit [uncultured Desulfobacterium sp.]
MGFPYDDMRSFIDDLEKEGELIRVQEEVDWNLEAGAIARRLAELTQGRSVKKGGQPAAVFENVKGYPKGFRLAVGTHYNPKRVSLAFGLEDSDHRTLQDLQKAFIDAVDHPIKPVVVKNGSCKENKLFGDEVNLYKFPAPMVHEGDGGRYMCTLHFLVSKRLDSDWTNWGMYRAMIHDKRTLGGLFIHSQHGPDIYYEYEAADKPMPFAIVIGADPLSLFFSAAPLPRGLSEVDAVGGARGKAVRMVKCETNDLMVPADAEIVIEGVVPPRVRAYEGPFGEFTGYRASPRDKRPVYAVKCITYRNDPILTMSCMGVPVDEGDIVWSVGLGSMYKRSLINAGLPVVDVNLPPEASGVLTVVSTKTPYRGIAHTIANVLDGEFKMVSMSQHILVVNDDVDIFNIPELLHTWASRVHPERDIFVRRGRPGLPLAPWADLDERQKMTAPSALYDATWSLDWSPEIAIPPKAAFKSIFPVEVQEKILSKWLSYGFNAV